MSNDATLKENVKTLERKHYYANDNGDVVARTSATGTFKLTGLTTGGLMTEITANDSGWTACPATALTGRNTLSIQNQGTGQIKYRYTNSGGYVGAIIEAGDTENIDITDSIVIYVRSLSGNQTVLANEIA